MNSFTPGGSILQVIAIHARASWVVACVNREWLEAVNAAISELTRGFLGSVFTVDCLGLASRMPSNVEPCSCSVRIRRLLRPAPCLPIRFGVDGPAAELSSWWYRTQWYLHAAIRRDNMSVHRMLHRCYDFSRYRGYDFDMFAGVFRRRTSENLDDFLDSRLFWNAGYVSARDLGCVNLGRSRDEVLQSLICALLQLVLLVLLHHGPHTHVTFQLL